MNNTKWISSKLHMINRIRQCTYFLLNRYDILSFKFFHFFLLLLYLDFIRWQSFVFLFLILCSYNIIEHISVWNNGCTNFSLYFCKLSIQFFQHFMHTYFIQHQSDHLPKFRDCSDSSYVEASLIFLKNICLIILLKSICLMLPWMSSVQ